jgi:cell shape-determining protein MreC
MLFAYLMLGGVIFLFLPMGLTGNLQLIYAGIFRTPLKVGRDATRLAQTVTTTQDPQTQECERLREENRLLKNGYANIVMRLKSAQDKIDELAGLRTHPEWSGMPLLPAGVITNPAGGQTELVIDCGQIDGVAVGHYVMADNSIIGKISAVSSQTARVRLITDPLSKIPVQVAAGKLSGIMVGRRDGTAGITQIPVSQPVEVNDVVFALRNPAAPGIPIITARVTGRTRAKEPLLWDISVRPVCDVVNLKSVIVIVPRK